MIIALHATITLAGSVAGATTAPLTTGAEPKKPTLLAAHKETSPEAVMLVAVIIDDQVVSPLATLARFK